VDQVIQQCRHAIGLTIQPVVLDGDILTFDVTGLANPFARMGLKSSDSETPTASYQGASGVPRQGEGEEG
jgi:hypothetical protein